MDVGAGFRIGLGERVQLSERDPKRANYLKNALRFFGDANGGAVYPQAAFELGRFYMLEGKWKEATEYFTKLQKKDPHYAEAAFYAGLGYAKMGEFGHALAALVPLARAAGVPARWQSGWETKPSNWNMHDWAEFYVEPWGWLPIDQSYGRRVSDDERVREFYFGHLAGETGATLELASAGAGDKGDQITLEVVANDGTASSAPSTSVHAAAWRTVSGWSRPGGGGRVMSQSAWVRAAGKLARYEHIGWNEWPHRRCWSFHSGAIGRAGRSSGSSSASWAAAVALGVRPGRR